MKNKNTLRHENIEVVVVKIRAMQSPTRLLVRLWWWRLGVDAESRPVDDAKSSPKAEQREV